MGMSMMMAGDISNVDVPHDPASFIFRTPHAGALPALRCKILALSRSIYPHPPHLHSYNVTVKNNHLNKKKQESNAATNRTTDTAHKDLPAANSAENDIAARGGGSFALGKPPRAPIKRSPAAAPPGEATRVVYTQSTPHHHHHPTTLQL